MSWDAPLDNLGRVTRAQVCIKQSVIQEGFPFPLFTHQIGLKKANLPPLTKEFTDFTIYGWPVLFLPSSILVSIKQTFCSFPNKPNQNNPAQPNWVKWVSHRKHRWMASLSAWPSAVPSFSSSFLPCFTTTPDACTGRRSHRWGASTWVRLDGRT